MIYSFFGLLFSFLIMTSSSVASDPANSTHTLWIGTGGGEAKGIYRASFDSATGKLSVPELAAEVAKPGFVAIRADKKRLYSVSSDDGGSVRSFSIAEDGTLTAINRQPIGVGTASHLSLDKTGRVLFTAQYGAGSVAAFPVKEDGSIEPRSSLIEHQGSGPDKSRQDKPHPHWTGVSPDNHFLFVPDLGTDQVQIYQVDVESATISPHGHGTVPPGSGPRHLKFSPDGSHIYVVNEMGMTVTVFAYDAEVGTMEAIQTIEALPESEWKIPNKGAEIRMHPSGRFLYTSNRGHDTITVFSVDSMTGKLSFVEREPIRGAYPRNFTIDPEGKWLLAGGRASNTIAIFRIDLETGRLYFTTDVVNTPAPICLEF